jgi:phosphonate transport system substrate-binding protein
LRGKVVSYPAPTALAAAMMPQLYLQNHGIDVETEITNTYVGTHNSSIMNAYLGQSAAGATWPVAWQAFEKANSKEASELYVIWQTPKLIQNAIVARNDVKPEVSARVQQLLATLHQSADGRALLANIDTENFEAANDAQFEVVVAFLKEYQTKVKKQR